jgi:hypothetical protein
VAPSHVPATAMATTTMPSSATMSPAVSKRRLPHQPCDKAPKHRDPGSPPELSHDLTHLPKTANHVMKPKQAYTRNLRLHEGFHLAL